VLLLLLSLLLILLKCSDESRFTLQGILYTDMMIQATGTAQLM